MIKSFKCKLTESLWEHGIHKKFPTEIRQIILRKLLMLDSVTELKDLLSPPENHLEYLKGDRKHQCSIRINSQWRICFIWKDCAVFDVEIVDYH